MVAEGLYEGLQEEENVWDGHWETEWGGRAMAAGSTLS